MSKYLLLVFALIFAALSWINWGIGVSDIYSEKITEPDIPHLYNNPNQPIGNIKISALYFVPKNKVGQQKTDWKIYLEDSLKKLQKFHRLQFQGRSVVSYEIMDKPVVGFLDNIEYDTNFTQHGNPEGLRRISAELEERKIIRGPTSLGRSDLDSYQVFLILYEGVGASGSENIALVSNIFMADPQYESIRATIIAHEFYHTLGIPDFYDIPTAIPTSLDIMGLGSSKPIEKTFISRETLKRMGMSN